MRTCVVIVIVLLVATKLADVISTLRRIAHPAAETNPLARRLMFSAGTTAAAWVVFALALAVIAIAAVSALRGGIALQAAFVVAGVGISAIQAAVAHANWTGRDNPITRVVRSFHAWLQRALER